MSTLDPSQSALSAIDTANVWINSERLTAERLRGRVVLVDFWTYSCVNWLRTLPYVRAWEGRYRDRGFIWRSFENHYWPAVYLVDREGNVRFHHFGEEAYEETERTVHQLLGVEEATVRVDTDGLFEAAGWDTLGSPETYLGSARSARRSDPDAGRLALNHWSLTGAWSVGSEAAVLDAAVGSVGYRFQARDLNLVLAPPAPAAVVRFSVRIDGQAPGDSQGLDIDAAGEGTVSERPGRLSWTRQASFEYRGPLSSAGKRTRAGSGPSGPPLPRAREVGARRRNRYGDSDGQSILLAGRSRPGRSVRWTGAWRLSCSP